MFNFLLNNWQAELTIQQLSFILHWINFVPSRLICKNPSKAIMVKLSKRAYLHPRGHYRLEGACQRSIGKIVPLIKDYITLGNRPSHTDYALARYDLSQGAHNGMANKKYEYTLTQQIDTWQHSNCVFRYMPYSSLYTSVDKSTPWLHQLILQVQAALS